MNEDFIDIKGYEGYYKINKNGDVKSLDRKVFNGKGFYIKKSQIMKPTLKKAGYYTITLHKEGNKYNVDIHLLMAYNFLNHKPSKHVLVVDHKDNNPLNNKLSNLQLISNRENCSKDRKNSNKYTGVYKSRGLYASQIVYKGKSLFLGRYKSSYFAHLVYRKKLININFTEKYGN